MTNYEGQPNSIQSTIEELLSLYYEANGEDLRYKIVRSMPIDGHDVAWMKFTGEVVADITGQGREGEPFEGYCLGCACEFTEGVGWKVENGQRYNLDGKEKCLPRQTAVYLRQLELQQEYLERFKSNDPWKTGIYHLKEHAPEIILDLIEKEKAGEFIAEDNGGASFWGGHFYLQTVAKILDIEMKDMWPIAHQMIADKQIQLEGAVVQTYFAPPEPSWNEYGRFEVDGWTGIASLPSHSKMPQEWKFTILDEKGEEVEIEVSTERLTHAPTFGPDVEDVAGAEQKIRELIQQAKAARQK